MHDLIFLHKVSFSQGTSLITLGDKVTKFSHFNLFVSTCAAAADLSVEKIGGKKRCRLQRGRGGLCSEHNSFGTHGGLFIDCRSILE